MPRTMELTSASVAFLAVMATRLKLLLASLKVISPSVLNVAVAAVMKPLESISPVSDVRVKVSFIVLPEFSVKLPVAVMSAVVACKSINPPNELEFDWLRLISLVELPPKEEFRAILIIVPDC